MHELNRFRKIKFRLGTAQRRDVSAAWFPSAEDRHVPVASVSRRHPHR